MRGVLDLLTCASHWSSTVPLKMNGSRLVYQRRVLKDCGKGSVMTSAVIDFWISVGSTYSYLTVMRLKAVEQATGIAFRWHPFSVRSIMLEQNNVPFRGKPVKAAYMWRDIERRAHMYGLSPRLPAPYPLSEFHLANRVAVVGEQEGWCTNYVCATYRRWFEEGQEAGSNPNLQDSLREIGEDADRVIEIARSADIESRYEMATQQAKALGVLDRQPSP
jgi:2-hydroxychromene-2-carboxylate isomerase